MNFASTFLRAKTMVAAGLLLIGASGSAHAVLFSAITNQSVSIGVDGTPDLDLTLRVIGDTGGHASMNITTASLFPQWQPIGNDFAVDVTLRVQAFDDGGSPPVTDFTGVRWALLDASGAEDNTADNYFFSPVQQPTEVTAFFANPVAYGPGPSIEHAGFSGGILPSTDPASEAVFFSRIFLDPTFNMSGGAMNLDMRVYLRGEAAVPAPGALPAVLALLGVMGMRLRRKRLAA